MHKRVGEQRGGDQQKIHSSSRNTRVLQDTTNTRVASAFKTGSDTSTNRNKNSYTNTTIYKKRPSLVSHRSSTKEDITHGGKQRASTATAPGLNDLLPQDKAKIARLVEQVMQLTNENAGLKEELAITEKENDECDQDYDHFKSEQQSFIAKRNDSLVLLRRYQDKIQFFSDELVYTRKAYDELSQRYNSSQNNIIDLELLVNNQRQTIDYEKNKHQSSLLSSTELQKLKEELRHRNEDCVRYKAKHETLESNSNYLATQLDGLLSQLTEKTNRIHTLEEKIRSHGAAAAGGADVCSHKQLVMLTSATDVLPPPPPTTTTTIVPLSEPNNLPPPSTSTSVSAPPMPTITPNDAHQSSSIITLESTDASANSNSNASFANSFSPPPKPRKVHTPEQLLASWSEQQNVENTKSEEENNIINSENVDGSKMEGGDHHLHDSSQAVKDDVAYNMSFDMSRSTIAQSSATEKSDRANATSSTTRLILHPDEGSVLTSSMKEASAVNITAPPLSLTPPRNNIARKDNVQHRNTNTDSFRFNDSSLDSSIMKNVSGNGNANDNNNANGDNVIDKPELTDEYFLETANRQLDSVSNTSITSATGAVVPVVGTNFGNNFISTEHINESIGYSNSNGLVEDDRPRRKAKRVSVKTSSTTTAPQSSSNISLKSQNKVTAQRKSTTAHNNNNNNNHHTTKQTNIKKHNQNKTSHHNKKEKDGITNGRTRRLPPSSPKSNKHAHSNSNSNSILPPGNAVAVSESPGLKAWEEVSGNYDGYGMQLFDLLDQIDEGVGASVQGIGNSNSSNNHNSSSSSSSSFTKLLDSSDLWL